MDGTTWREALDPQPRRIPGSCHRRADSRASRPEPASERPDGVGTTAGDRPRHHREEVVSNPELQPAPGSASVRLSPRSAHEPRPQVQPAAVSPASPTRGSRLSRVVRAVRRLALHGPVHGPRRQPVAHLWATEAPHVAITRCVRGGQGARYCIEVGGHVRCRGRINT